MKIRGIIVAGRSADSYSMKTKFGGCGNLLTAPDTRILSDDEEIDPEIPVKTDDATLRIKIKTIP
jgi:hypothetical protein